MKKSDAIGLCVLTAFVTFFVTAISMLGEPPPFVRNAIVVAYNKQERPIVRIAFEDDLQLIAPQIAVGGVAIFQCPPQIGDSILVYYDQEEWRFQCVKDW